MKKRLDVNPIFQRTVSLLACYAGMKARREPSDVFAYDGSRSVREYVKPASVVLLALPLTYSIRISNHYVKELNKNPALCVGFWLLRSLKAKPGTDIRSRIRRLVTRKRKRQTRIRRKLSVTTDRQHS